MTDASDDHEGTVSIGGRTITNLRFADDIDGLAGEEEELANLVERLDTPRPTAWRPCREDQDDDTDFKESLSYCRQL